MKRALNHATWEPLLSRSLYMASQNRYLSGLSGRPLLLDDVAAPSAGHVRQQPPANQDLLLLRPGRAQRDAGVVAQPRGGDLRPAGPHRPVLQHCHRRGGGESDTSCVCSRNTERGTRALFEVPFISYLKFPSLFTLCLAAQQPWYGLSACGTVRNTFEKPSFQLKGRLCTWLRIPIIFSNFTPLSTYGAFALRSLFALPSLPPPRWSSLIQLQTMADLRQRL